MEKIKAEVILGLQAKPEFLDLETMAQKINTKADFQKVQELVNQMKTEVVNQVAEIKKEVRNKKKKDLNKTKQEQDFALDKLCEEIKGLKDKLTKLASQFDKELIDRDKALKSYQHGLWDDIQQLIQAMQREND